MDKLIPILNSLKQNRFWIVCGIISIAMVATWFVSTAQLAKAKKAAESDINSKIAAAEAVFKTTAADVGDGIVAHPNDTTIAGMKAEIQEGIDAVLAAWEMRRTKQQDSLVWPEVVGQDFIKVFGQYMPFESFPVDKDPTYFESYLKIYAQQIPERMDDISNIIGTRWKWSEEKQEENTQAGDGKDAGEDRPNVGPGGRDRGGSRPSPPGSRGGSVATSKGEDDNSIVVRWNEENQDLWHDKLTLFRNFDDNQMAYNYPTPLQIFMLQQDLWLLEAVFTIIKEVNGDANANDLARIKQIDHIAFGREARAQLGELSKPNPRLASNQSKESSGSGLSKGKNPSNNRRGRDKKETTDPFASKPDKFNSPFHGRYVNSNFEPIPAEDVRQSLDPKRTELPDKNIELVVAKRVPVRIAVRMDERYIPDFISKSANHPFAFEINQVRINKHVPGEGIVMVGASSGGAGTRGRGDDAPPDRGSSIGSAGGAGMMGGEGEMGGQSNEDDGRIETRTDYDVDVEFYGIVKIYNPVNRALLTGELTGQKPAKANPGGPPSP